MNHVIIRYSEIGLKGKNRVSFEKRLIENIKMNLKNNGHSYKSVKRCYGRIIVQVEGKCECLKDVLGISSFSFAIEVSQDMKNIIKEIMKDVNSTSLNVDNTFCVRVQRIDKRFPMTSVEMEREIGQVIVDKTSAKVKLKDSDFVFYIELIDSKAYVFMDKIRGYGGLPVGSGGKVASLLSTGIDSPVAAWMAMKRGCRNVIIFNYNYPFSAKEEKDFAVAQFRNLKRFDPLAKLYIVPFGNILKEIKEKTKQRYYCILCKRLMYRIANLIAEKEKAMAIVTGESIGQVASQTIENLFVLDKASDLPVLRPVIGMNKQEIIDIARKIGTYRQSIETKGKCGLLPSCPATRARLDLAENEEKRIDLDIIDKVVDDSEIIV